jgi:hypothetical protein
MPTLPTSSERTDTALTLAKTRAAAYADAGKMDSAYKALLRGVRSAQRVNNASKAGTTLAGLWAMPTMKAGVLGATTAIAAVVTRSKSKTKAKSDATPSDPSTDPSTSTSDVSASRPPRFRRRPRPTDHAAVSQTTMTSKLDD